MVRTAIQLYTLRHADETVPKLIEEVGTTAFEGVEFAGLDDPDAAARSLNRADLGVAGAHISFKDLEAAPADIARTIDETGLTVADTHTTFSNLEDDPTKTFDRYTAVGCDRFVVPYLAERHFESDAAIERIASRLSRVAGALASRGVDLYYHNHGHEFVDVNGETGYDAFVAEANEVEFELDLGWAASAGVDPVSLLDRHGDRISMVHVSDADADGNPVDLGEGTLDVERAVAAAIDAGVDWIIYEHDDPDDPYEVLKRSAADLERLVDEYA